MSEQREDLIQRLVLSIFRLDDLLKEAANHIARPAGQTGARWQVLNALQDGPKTVADIARSKNVARQGIQRIVNELLAEGVVEARSNPRHARYPLIASTPAGLAARELILENRRRWIAGISGGLEGELTEETLLQLDRFQAAVEKTLPKR